jgi:RNA-directed DNA polymerase
MEGRGDLTMASIRLQDLRRRLYVKAKADKDWRFWAVDRRLREELAKLDLRLNEAKSRVVDLTQEEVFGFLGFTFRRLRSRRGRWWVFLAPALKKRTALVRKLQEVFRRWRSQPVRRVIAEINPILRGWVNYFRVGNAARCLGQRGFGWKRWSRVWLHTTLGLFADYRVRYWGRA